VSGIVPTSPAAKAKSMEFPLLVFENLLGASMLPTQPLPESGI
jgi:hypothetical protein